MKNIFNAAGGSFRCHISFQDTWLRGDSGRRIREEWQIGKRRRIRKKTAVQAEVVNRMETGKDPREAIRHLIKTENPRKPFSDRVLSEKLAEAGDHAVAADCGEIPGRNGNPGCIRAEVALVSDRKHRQKDRGKTMSLQFIIGGSGSGKTRTLYENLIRQSMEEPDERFFCSGAGTVYDADAERES